MTGTISDFQKRSSFRRAGCGEVGWLLTHCSSQVLDALSIVSNLSGHMCQSTPTLLAVSSLAHSQQMRVVQCPRLSGVWTFSSSCQLEILLYLDSTFVCQNYMYLMRRCQISYKRFIFYWKN